MEFESFPSRRNFLSLKQQQATRPSSTSFHNAAPLRSSRTTLANSNIGLHPLRPKSKAANNSYVSARSISPPGRQESPSFQQSQQQLQDRVVQEEYVRNLQQQIYLLELETRYLRNKPSDNIETDKAAAPLKDTFRTLKHKYVEMQDEYKREIESLKEKLEFLKKENEIQALKLQNAHKEIEESKKELKTLQDNRESEIAHVQNENVTLNQARSLHQAEIDRLELSYNRVKNEKEELAVNYATLISEVKLLRDQRKIFDDSKSILEKKLEETTSENVRLMTRLESSSFAELSAAYETLQNLHKVLKGDYATVQRDFIKTQHQLTSVQAQHAETLTLLTAAQDELSKALSDLQEVTAERNLLRSQIDDERNRTQLSREDASKVNEKIDFLQRQVDQEKSERILCENHLAQCMEDSKKLVAVCEGERESKAVLQDKIESLERKIVSLEEARSKLGLDYDSSIQTLKQQESTRAELETTVKTLNDQLTTLKVELDCANLELKRRQHVAKLVEQVRHWKTMMKQSAKVATDMNEIVNALMDTEDKSEKITEDRQTLENALSGTFSTTKSKITKNAPRSFDELNDALEDI